MHSTCLHTLHWQWECASTRGDHKAQVSERINHFYHLFDNQVMKNPSKDPTEKSILTLVEVLVERWLYSVELFCVWEFIWFWWSSLSVTLLLGIKFKSLELWIPPPQKKKPILPTTSGILQCSYVDIVVVWSDFSVSIVVSIVVSRSSLLLPAIKVDRSALVVGNGVDSWSPSDSPCLCHKLYPVAYSHCS